MAKLDWQKAKTRDEQRLARLDGPPSPKSFRKKALQGMPTWAQLQAPICPRCQQLMQLRTKRADGSRFWGCPNFPICKRTQDVVNRKGR